MITSAEEQGLSGLALAGQVRRAFARIPEATLVNLIQRLRDEAALRHLVSLRGGHLDTIRVLPCPLPALSDQVSYLQHAVLTIVNTLKRLPALYLSDPLVRQTLKLPPTEETLLAEGWGQGLGEHNPVFARLDAVIDFTNPMWKETLRFFDLNLTDLSNLHHAPTAERLVIDVVGTELRRQDDRLLLSPGADPRDLLLREVFAHAHALGRLPDNLCLLEPQFSGRSVEELEELTQFFHDHDVMNLFRADPRELTFDQADVCLNDEPIDFACCAYTTSEIVELHRQGVDIEPMRALFRENRVISSVTGALDQKACWEVLTDPQLGKHFSTEERQVFRRHLPWTRYLAPRRTLLPNGQVGELIDFVRQEQESLVLKPNRGRDGRGVVLGLAVSPETWTTAVDRAVSDHERWVVQQAVPLVVAEFPLLGQDGSITYEPSYLVLECTATQHGLAIVGRASSRLIVVADKYSSLGAVLSGQPTRRSIGGQVG
jgi:hypothetical protein